MRHLTGTLGTSLKLFRDRIGFRFTPSGSSTLLSNCFGVLAAELLGLLDPNDSWYQRVRESIASRQQPDGFWTEPLLQAGDLRGRHTAGYLEWQQVYFALHALDALGSRPKYRLDFLTPFLNPASAVDWLRSRDYSDFWYAGNEIMWLLSFLAFEAQQGSAEALASVDAMLDELDARQDPTTGFWGTAHGSTLFQGMAGAFHVYYFYFWRRRPVAHMRKVIDHTLALQHQDGLFHPGAGGGSCHDLDAVDILVKFSLRSDYRAADIERSLHRAYVGLWATQNEDGGFCERAWRPARSLRRRIGEALLLDRLLNSSRPVTPPVYSHAGWRLMECPVTQSNLWATWFRPLALALISVRYPGKYLPGSLWTFRRLPGLGWHDAKDLSTLTAREDSCG